MVPQPGAFCRRSINGFLLASAGVFVNFLESIASQFLPFFDSDRKQLLVVGFATISTSSLDSSANLSLSSVAVINGFLLAPEVCLCEFARVDGPPVFPFRWQTEALVVQSIKTIEMILSEVEQWRLHSWRSVVKKL